MRYLEGIAFVLVVLALSCVQGCSLSAEQRARTTLNTMSMVIEPAATAADVSCAEASTAVADKFVAGGFATREAGQAALDRVAGRCSSIEDAYAVIAALYNEAVRAVEAGQIKEAQALVVQLTQAWANVRKAAK